jgi:predicted RNA binding protein YcfA (HicA-like mRNA interferase family)
MTKLPVISGRQCIRALERAGFAVARDKSSHVVMKRQQPPARITVPDHRELAPGTLRAIIRQAGLSVVEFAGLVE